MNTGPMQEPVTRPDNQIRVQPSGDGTSYFLRQNGEELELCNPRQSVVLFTVNNIGRSDDETAETDE